MHFDFTKYNQDPEKCNCLKLTNEGRRLMSSTIANSASYMYKRIRSHTCYGFVTLLRLPTPHIPVLRPISPSYAFLRPISPSYAFLRLPTSHIPVLRPISPSYAFLRPISPSYAFLRLPTSHIPVLRPISPSYVPYPRPTSHIPVLRLPTSHIPVLRPISPSYVPYPRPTSHIPVLRPISPSYAVPPNPADPGFSRSPRQPKPMSISLPPQYLRVQQKLCLQLDMSQSRRSERNETPIADLQNQRQVSTAIPDPLPHFPHL